MYSVGRKLKKGKEVAKITVLLLESSKRRPFGKNFLQKRAHIDLRQLNNEQRRYFREAHAEFLSGADCWKFEAKYISKGPAMAKLLSIPSRRRWELGENPLYLALEELWMALVVDQSKVSAGYGNRRVFLLI